MAAPDTPPERVLEGIFAVAKPSMVSSADVLVKLQATFASSRTFAPLLRHQPKRTTKGDDQVFRLGHGGTLDPLAAGVLIVGIGRGTKHLQTYLACTKTYETVVLFGASTDSYDCTGTITEQAPCTHVTKDLVQDKLAHFRGTITQAPPAYSALKVNGIKACEYVRQGLPLPRQLEARQMHVDECELLEWFDPGQHHFAFPDQNGPAVAPVARIRLTVSSGFYVRSFAHDLGIACQSRSHMVSLLRTRQATFSILDRSEAAQYMPALTYENLDAGEDTWGPMLRSQLEEWVEANPANTGHVNGRSRDTKHQLAEERGERPKQRFRGEWVAETKQERIKQQGGRFKGKWSRKQPVDALSSRHPTFLSDSAEKINSAQSLVS